MTPRGMVFDDQDRNIPGRLSGCDSEWNWCSIRWNPRSETMPPQVPPSYQEGLSMAMIL
jgi:hypothetical protein